MRCIVAATVPLYVRIVEALILPAQLARPDQSILTPAMYKILSVRGFTMIF